MKVLLILTKNNYPNPAPDVNTFGQGLPYIAGALKAAGHQVVGLDVTSIWCHGGAPLFLEQVIRQAVELHCPDLIGVGGMASNYHFLRDAIDFSHLFAPDVPVVLGGGIITYDVQYIFDDLRPEFGIVGEGELAISALADSLAAGSDLSLVPSLVWRFEGQVVCNPTRYIEDLDDLPMPDYSPFRFEDHLSLNSRTNDFFAHTQVQPRIMPISMGRSCPFKCTFCCHHKQEGVFSARYRTRSIQSVMAEIEHLYALYRFNVLYVHDEVFAVQASMAREFTEQLIALKQRLGIEFDWGCYLRVNAVDLDLLMLMKQSSCCFIGFGMESASDTVLKSMRKGIRKKDIKKAIDLTTQAGIGIHSCFIFGDPAETAETIRETIDFFKVHCHDLAVQFFYITPYPGTALWSYSQKKKLLPERKAFYETIAHSRCGLNMSSLDDDELIRLTHVAMHDTYTGRTAAITGFHAAEGVSCDLDAPFEMRRSLYWIEAQCPYCEADAKFLYPLRIELDLPVQPFMHFCPHCHRKLILDVADRIDSPKQISPPGMRFCGSPPYNQYYPFDGLRMSMQSVPTPQFVERVSCYNILKYANKYYAVAHSLGPMDLTKLTRSQIRAYQSGGGFIVASSLEEARQRIP